MYEPSDQETEQRGAQRLEMEERVIDLAQPVECLPYRHLSCQHLGRNPGIVANICTPSNGGGGGCIDRGSVASQYSQVDKLHIQHCTLSYK